MAWFRNPFSRPVEPSTVLEKAWRKLEWSKREDMVKTLKKFHLIDTETGCIRILLNGPIAAGKSSFINSVRSVFADRVMTNVLADSNCAGDSFTKKYETHYIKDGDGRLSIVFNDVMGLEPQESGGVHPDDIVNALKGHVPHGYEFNSTGPLTEKKTEYNRSPKPTDKVHCLVSVVSADAMSLMSHETIRKMRIIREKASHLGIPQHVVLTMIDKTCPKVAEDLTKVYHSKVIKEKMERCSNELGVPMNCIYPVKNYHEETELKNDIDVLLDALTHIMHAANDYMWDLQQHD